MADPYQSNFSSRSDPGEDAVDVIPDDDADLPRGTPKTLYVGTGGDIAMIGDDAAPDAAPVIWRNVPTGSCPPFRPRRVCATGTTATDILAVY